MRQPESNHPSADIVVNATRAGIARASIGDKFAAAGLATLILPFPVAWISHAIWPGNPVREALKHGAGTFLLFVIAPILFAVGIGLRNRARGAGARVTVQGGALCIERSNGVERIRLDELTEGVIVPKVALSELQLRRRNGDIVVIEAASNDERMLERLLRATGIGPDRRRLRTRVGGWQTAANRTGVAFVVLLFTLVPLFKWIGGVVAGNVGTFADMAFRIGTLGLTALLAWVIANASLGPEIVIGTDGVNVRSIFKDRFLPHDSIATVERAGLDVRLKLQDGSYQRLGSTKDDSQARALMTRIQRAREVTSAAPEAAARAGSLDRSGRTLADWRAALALLAKPETGRAYRSAPLERADLLRVVADPDVPADRRIGAALALDVAKDADAAGHVRVAAETCADARVRVALGSIAAGETDDDALDAATRSDHEGTPA